MLSSFLAAVRQLAGTWLTVLSFGFYTASFGVFFLFPGHTLQPTDHQRAAQWMSPLLFVYVGRATGGDSLGSLALSLMSGGRLAG